MKHHPDIELLLKYVNGQIAPSLALAIGLHQQQCKSCQHTINELETLGGTTLETIPAATTSSDASTLKDFELLMSHIDESDTSGDSTSFVDQFDQLAVSQTDLPLLDRLATQNFESIRWQRIGFKIWRSEIVMNDDGYSVELLKFSANTKIPKHTHRGNEFTLVLQGDFKDQADHYQTGEFIVQDPTNEHQPIAGDKGCICLAITDAPLKFTGTLGPVLNWFNR